MWRLRPWRWFRRYPDIVVRSARKPGRAEDVAAHMDAMLVALARGLDEYRRLRR